eukprot:GILK01008442.1.p1 GENE.GILK01008442.1~~GILK01008442.1.p1  ORF type:complete len:602 (+),score=68.88 GILK01008442.1:48-1808(+)
MSSVFVLVFVCVSLLVIDVNGEGKGASRVLVFSEQLNVDAILSGFNVIEHASSSNNDVSFAQLVLYNSTTRQPFATYNISNCTLAEHSLVATKTYQENSALETIRYAHNFFLACLHSDGSISSIEKFTPINITFGSDHSYRANSSSSSPFYFTGGEPTNLLFFGSHSCSKFDHPHAAMMEFERTGIIRQADAYPPKSSNAVSILHVGYTRYGDYMLVWISAGPGTAVAEAKPTRLTFDIVVRESFTRKVITFDFNTSADTNSSLYRSMAYLRHESKQLFVYMITQQQANLMSSTESAVNVTTPQLTLWRLNTDNQTSLSLNDTCVLSLQFYMDSIFIIGCPITTEQGQSILIITEIHRVTFSVMSMVHIPVPAELVNSSDSSLIRPVLTSRSLLLILPTSSDVKLELIEVDQLRICPCGSRLIDSADGSTCRLCPPLTFSDKPSSSVCSPCRAGTESSVTREKCQACSDGYRTRFMAKCEFCAGRTVTVDGYPIDCIYNPHPYPPNPSPPPIPPYNPPHGGDSDVADPPQWLVPVLAVGAGLGLAALLFATVKYLRYRRLQATRHRERASTRTQPSYYNFDEPLLS